MAHHFLRTNEWQHLVDVFRYYFRDGNQNIKQWKTDRDDRRDETVETLTAVEFAMQGLQDAVRMHRGADIRAFEVSLVQQLLDALEHFHTRKRCANDLCRARYDCVKMEFFRDGALVECHRLWDGVKYVRLCVLLRRIYEVLEGDKHWSVTVSWPEWSEWPDSGKYQVAPEPVLVVPVVHPDGSIAVPVPLTPTTVQEEEEQRLLDPHPCEASNAGPDWSGPAGMRAMLQHMNQLTLCREHSAMFIQ